MKEYFRTFIVGILGIAGFTISYIKNLPIPVQISIGVTTFIGVTIIGLFEKKIQLAETKKVLIDKMKYHANYVFLTNGSESEMPVVAQELDKEFNSYNKNLRLEAIAIVLRVSNEQAKEMLAEKIPDYIAKNTHVFRITQF
jgi:hypothetical protein